MEKESHQMTDEIVPQEDQTTETGVAGSEPEQKELAENELSEGSAPEETAEIEIDDNQNTENDGSEPDEVEPSKAVKELIGKRKQVREVRQENELLKEKLAYLEKVKGNEENQVEANNNGEPQLEEFTNHEDPYAAWQDAIIEHKASRVVEKKLLESKNQEQIQAVQSTYQKRMSEFKINNPEMADKLTVQWPKEVIDGVSRNGAAREILESEKAPQLEVYYAENPAQAYRLAAMDNRQAIREIAKIEARLSTPTKQPQTRKVSQTPPPVKSSVGGPVKSGKSIADMTVSEYSDYMNRQQYGG